LGLNPDGLPYSVQSPKASPTLVGSPTFQPANHYLSSTASLPTSANTSPRLSPEPTLAPAAGPSTSPRLGTFTEPLGRLANGLVRRGSTQNIKSGGQLPVAHASNAGPRPAPPPPSISLSGLGVGPELTGRRNGYGADIPSRGKKGFGIGLGGSRFGGGGGGGGGHGRMFSWGRVADDPHLKRKLQSQRKWKRKLLIVSIVIAFGIAATRYFGLHDPVSVAQLARPDTRRKSGVRPVRRPEGGGKNFIHPDVIRRTDEMPEGWFHAPMRWFMALYQFDDPRYYSGQVGDRSAEAEPSKRRGLFVPAPHVAFEEHKALPPPPLHSDDPERDTLVLYRILGNDLPPRHSPGQTLRNLRFLLQHESDFSALSHLGPHGEHHAAAYGSGTQARKMHSDEGGLRVDKYFVLNRIAEPSMVSAIVGLLHLYSVPDSRILHIPFEWDEYERREFRWDGGVDKVLGWGVGDGTQKPRDHVSVEDLDAAVEETENHHHRERDERRKRSEMTSRLRALDFTYHEKNLYAMNNNGGRNFALDHGRDLPNARWILPLDGNSFLTPAAMYSIVRTLSVAGEGEGASRYVVIPMARLLSNTDVRASNSIALVPKTHEHELGKSAAEVAELNHQLGAPEALEEPQIGFRYDSTESYQEAMRYGRRSKLELLWRLGAIPYSRRLDSRTLPWEVSDREHITADSWGSIPGYQGLAHGSPVHDAHGNEEDFQPWMAQNPERGPLAFVKAGWVYRLFSGYKSQEQHNSEAAVLRNMNRIKGIVAFLERLDEKVARGQEGCPPDERPGGCGYTPDSLWNFDRQAVDYLRQRFGAKVDQVVGRVQKFEKVASGVHADVSLLDEEDDEALAGCDPHEASINATVLAMAGYVTGNESYSALAATIVTKRFIDEAAVRHAEEYKGARGFSWLKRIAAQSKPGFEEEAVGYAFPAAPFDVRKNPSWNTPEMAKSASKDWPTVPYDPIEFDVSRARHLPGFCCGLLTRVQLSFIYFCSPHSCSMLSGS